MQFTTLMSKYEKGKTSGKARKILLHLLGWLILISLNYILTSIYQDRFNPYLHIITWAISIIVFYVSYLLLMPFFLFRKKSFLFIVFSVFLFASSISLAHVLINNTFSDQILQRTIENRVKEGFPERKPVDKRPERSSRRNMLWIYSIFLFYASGTTLSLIERWNKDQRNIMEKEKEQILAELTFLKNQVNPHFLFNSLNSIYSLSIQKSDQTTQSILILSNLLRYMLYETQSDLVPIQKEMDYISDYIELQKLRVSDKTKITYSLPGKIMQLSIEPLLLIPVFENAFKYGVDNTRESHIDISVKITSREMIDCEN